MNNDTIRVRFAPSPTGWLHVGGLRTALYNYLFARRANGRLILRIEDTDRGRLVPEAAERLADALAWAGIQFDEGPGIGGAYGPYIQSMRLPMYREHVDALVAQGKAYPCFCTPEELDTARARQADDGQNPAYARTCRAIPPDDAAARVQNGETHTIRMKVPLTGETTFQDEIRGAITVSHDVIDDQVLLKSDGFPTYHLANVVDDHFMAITHVIRGEEWLPSTAKHVLLYHFFGWESPVFAHLPLLLNPDRSKLSKRQGDVAVEDYRNNGYLPEALVNFVALLGWNTSDDRELYTLDELVDAFSLDRVGKAGAVFDVEKLKWFNGQYLRALNEDQLTAACEPWLTEAGIDTADRERCTRITQTLKKHLTLPSDIVDELRPILNPAPVPENDEAAELLSSTDSAVVLEAVHAEVRAVASWEPEQFSASLKAVQKRTGIRGKGLFMPVRIALTGRLHGPELAGIAMILGREETLRRLAAAAAERGEQAAGTGA